MARPSVTPDALRQRTLLDAAGLIALQMHHPDIEPGLLRHLADGPEDEADDDMMARWARAGLAHVRELFPSSAPGEVEAAWERARALDRVVTLAVAREMGYPSEAGTPQVDPEEAAPGFSADVYRLGWDDALFALR